MKNLLLMVLQTIFVIGLTAQDMPFTINEKMQLVSKHTKAFQPVKLRGKNAYFSKGEDGKYCILVLDDLYQGYKDENAALKLWISSDLATWEDKGYIWEQDGAWRFYTNIEDSEQKYISKSSMPRINYLYNTWWISFDSEIPGYGLLKSTTGKPEGPYVTVDDYNMKFLLSSNYVDSDGTIFRFHGSMGELVMTDTLDKYDMEIILPYSRTDEHNNGIDIGIVKLKRNYLLFSCQQDVEGENLCFSSSKKLLGKYKGFKGLVKNSYSIVPFEDFKGNWWAVAKSNDAYESYESNVELWLVPIEIAEFRKKMNVVVLDEAFKTEGRDNNDYLNFP